jgi:hypothetical protein
MISFSSPPHIGYVYKTSKGKRWKLISTTPYVRKDGSDSYVLIWSDGINVGTTGLKSQSVKKNHLTDDEIEKIAERISDEIIRR